MTFTAEGLRGELLDRTAAAEAAKASTSVSAPGPHGVTPAATPTTDLVVDELFMCLDPIGRAVASACATLRKGITQLREIEVALGLPKPLGVTASATANAAVNAHFPCLKRSFSSTTPKPAAPRVKAEVDCDNKERATYISSATETRIVALLWEEEVLEGDADAVVDDTLARLNECRTEILRLAHGNLISQYCNIMVFE
ncbi:unnamed protein product [Discula destructiva]